jgi:hypothetical protein
VNRKYWEYLAEGSTNEEIADLSASARKPLPVTVRI